MARPRKYKTTEEAKKAQRAQIKAWNQRNRETINEASRERYSTKEGRAYQLAAAYNQLDSTYRNTESTITAGYIVERIFTSTCYWCGEDDWRKLGCDRIDNTKPHTPENVICSCGRCNVKRKTMTMEKYREISKN